MTELVIYDTTELVSNEIQELASDELEQVSGGWWQYAGGAAVGAATYRAARNGGNSRTVSATLAVGAGLSFAGING